MTFRLITLAGLVMLSTSLSAQQTVRVAVRDESRLWIEGSSNLHDWSCKATKLDAAIRVDPKWSSINASDPAFPELVRSVEVKVPVKEIRCGKSKMDGLLHQALAGDRSPEIGYVLGTFDVVPAQSGSTLALQTTGSLTIAGQTREVHMKVVAERLADGSVKATGELPILMTDYGVKPPTALLGTLKTRNEVVVKFELLVAREALVAATTATAPTPE